MRGRVAALVLVLLTGCEPPGHGPIASGISAPLGEPLPSATPDQLATFERGRAVALRRFGRADGLGPAFNVTFCAACHERPVTGGSGGHYRSFFIGGQRRSDGSFQFVDSAGPAGGVIRLYDDAYPARPAVPDETNVVGVRNPIPFFGAGLLAEISDAEILRRADPDDADGDGISGRANFDRGFVGRFGRKAQTVSIEGFIRGPLFNHLGVTSDPLTNEQRARLPVDSSDGSSSAPLTLGDVGAAHGAQAAAPMMPTTDDDGAPDPELSPEDLFDLVSFAMLLAAPEVEPTDTPELIEGRDAFDAVGCGGCHAPRLESPRGPLPVYSDLLLHDMGPDLADGLDFGLATGSELRTQPLWGLSAVGPYMHDGRATTIEEAILAHGGEAQRARDAFAALGAVRRERLIGFLESLGGREQATPGLLPPNAPVPSVGEPGGPSRALSGAEADRFAAGRALFDRDFGFSEGVGGPRFNGDSCRACHFDPVVGGSGPRGVNVMRHGIESASGEFVPPTVGTVLHRMTSRRGDANANRAQRAATIFEMRQTPTLLGLGRLEAVPDAVIEALADPDDTITPDGISGRVSRADGGRLGRFGWKAQVPSLLEFTRDALTTELGLTMPFADGLVFGRLHDNDAVLDPEIGLDDVELLADFVRLLGPPVPATPDDVALAARGEEVFSEVGCARCHVPALDAPDGPVRAYTDLLLHEILPPDALGIEEVSASMRELRTPPLWGLRDTGPYLHTGAADTIDEAIRAHDGEAVAVRDAYVAAPEADRAALVAFLGSL
ncbi:MAG: hypothetical protein KC619_22035 [Myxococcales bacterium]|nr:hypothetical protein [Myxococcales bacterium]